ncbi:hypothetical protein [Novosphingobium sp. RL4]|uniref:hypothetical protein n=1 Tax=Novosphingobium sp. RL4 TaxID=3109595 RepID=UPI002D76708F|nr:hypothetical protein [Novosphingobium sp. RL4]WRT94460.1 hypothetical protein U9J33_08150 [Novosphingobium sp. RL4]
MDKDRLERLRTTAYCIKHNDRELYDHHPVMFDPDCVPEGRAIYSSSWSEALRLHDADILDFFDAVRKSATVKEGANRKVTRRRSDTIS